MAFNWQKKINSRLQLYFFSLILFAIGIAIVSFLYVQRLKAYHTLRHQVDELLVISPRLMRAEQEFLLYDWQNDQFMQEATSTHLQEYHKLWLEKKQRLDQVTENPLTQHLDVFPILQKIHKISHDHHDIFKKLVIKLRQRGHKNYGSEGKMREAIHEIQKMKSLDKVELLILRKFEKDYFLRKDNVYADSLAKQALKLANVARKQKVTVKDMSKMTLLMRAYLKNFEKIVQLETEMGDQQGGLKAEMASTVAQIEKLLKQMDEVIDGNIIALEDNANFIVIIFFLIMFAMAVIFSIVIARNVSAPIVLLDRVVQSVTKGLRNQEVLLDKIKSKDEVGSLARNIQILLKKIKGLLQQASEKNIKLEEFNQQEAKRAWFNEGLAMFNEILRQSDTNVETQAYTFITELVKYTKSQQGALFLIQDEDGQANQVLELKASYAYQRQKSNRKPFEKGEELIGTVWEHGKTIYLEDLPENYTQIHSAMGTIAPKCLLIVPIKADDLIVGVLELLCITNYEPYQIEWIEAVVRRLGTSLTTLQTHIRTKYFLSESEKQASQAQESENRLQKQVEEYQHWMIEFEHKVNHISEESLIFTTVLGKMFSGVVITDEYFRIRQMNGYLTKKLGFRRNELIGKPLELFLDTDYRNIIDWKERSQDISFNQHTPLHTGKIRQRQGEAKSVEVISGKMQMETRIVYVFLLNEYSESELIRNSNGKPKTNNLTEKKA